MNTNSFQQSRTLRHINTDECKNNMGRVGQLCKTMAYHNNENM